jgi:competence protein ComEC
MERIKKDLHKIILFSLVCIAVLLVFLYILERNNDTLKVYFLDIGQGDAIYMRSPSGKDMLIDGGPSKLVLQKLAMVMPWYDKNIDVLLETHPDADHIGGFPEVIKRYKVGVFVEPGVESKNTIDDEIRKLRREKGIESVKARRGMVIDLGDQAAFYILFPDSDVSDYKDTNDASVVGELKFGSTTIMFTGDTSQKIEDDLVKKYGESLDSDILKVGHHGSKTSSGKSFVELVSPEYAVISAGKDNRYGHPHKEVIELFDSLHVKILETYKEGIIEFDSDGKTFIRK